MNMMKKIDYVTVIYKNYKLIHVQLELFGIFFSKKDYNLIIVDNTPDNFKSTHDCELLKQNPIVDKFISIPSSEYEFDGVSHGTALDAGILETTSEIICTFDSDYFFLRKDLNSYIFEKFKNGYYAVGSSWVDAFGTDFWRNQKPHLFENLPVCWESFYKREVLQNKSFVITELKVSEEKLNYTGFIEVGWEIRKFLIDNQLKTLSWDGVINKDNTTSFFDGGTLCGLHYSKGSYDRSENINLESILKIVQDEENINFGK